MRIAIVTDCWVPEMNGVVVTLQATVRALQSAGHEVQLVTPQMFACLTLPYGDRLVLPSFRKLDRLLSGFRPDSIHLATQGVLGFSARRWARRRGVHFTTAFHTRFPEYARIRFGLPERILYRYARWFHGRTAPVLVATRDLAQTLERRHVGRPMIWSRGVDTDLFRPGEKTWTAYPRPLKLYVGRVVEEKNVEAFFQLGGPGTRIVVGDGPRLNEARAKHPEVVFLGALEGEALAECYREADVLVFTSLLDTFGLVVLEALASGVPVAAFPTPHLVEVFAQHGGVAFDSDLEKAVDLALAIPPEFCRKVADQFSWHTCTAQLVGIIEADLARHRGAQKLTA